MTDKTLVKTLVGLGLTYEATGKALGISKQRVHQIVAASVSGRECLGKKIIYPNLLMWSIEHKVTREEFLRRMGYPTDKSHKNALNRVLNGVCMPKKDYIDKMLLATGLTYEVLFGGVVE